MLGRRYASEESNIQVCTSSNPARDWRPTAESGAVLLDLHTLFCSFSRPPQDAMDAACNTLDVSRQDLGILCRLAAQPVTLEPFLERLHRILQEGAQPDQLCKV